MRKNSLNLILIFLAAMAFIWAIWQHEILVDPFQSHWMYPSFLGRNIGSYYDWSLAIKYVALVGSFLTAWFWSKKDESYSVSILSTFIITYIIATVWHEIIVFPYISSGFQIFSGIIMSGTVGFILTMFTEILCFAGIQFSLWYWKD